MKHKTITSKTQITPNIDLFIINSDEKTARAIITSLIQKKSKAKIATIGRDNIFNRRALETLKINYLISPELAGKQDTLRQRDSGLNHVLAKIAKQNNITIVIDFQDINKIKNKKAKATRLARIIQNIKICRKAKCKIQILDFSGKADKRQLRAFGFSLGMSSQQVRDAVS